MTAERYEEYLTQVQKGYLCGLISRWELDFFSTIRSRMLSGKLSKKQASVKSNILFKVTG